MNDTIKGMFLSLTTWFGAFLLAWPSIMSDVGEFLTGLVGGDAANNVLRVIGLIVVLLRLKTTKSLSEKGAAA